ncbi:MAG: hypothetical protein E6Q68_07330 [Polynucleobacter sp.]|nr:MAG: hypothetical protein E6Q68_07330 [Polynucleobacter sp.]
MRISNSECVSFLEKLGPFDYAITINLKKRHPIYKIYINQEIANKTAEWFYKALSKKTLGRKYRYKHANLNCIYSVEIGSLEKRHHIHMAISKPSNITSDDFLDKLNVVHQKMDWRHGDIHLTSYHSSNWIKYLMKEGFEKVGFL